MRLLKIMIIVNILVFLFACDENIPYKGDIIGFVKFIDENGNEPIDKSGVNVTIEGLSNSVNTNEIGRFELKDVPAGTYKIKYNKTGYGEYTRLCQFIGGDIPALLLETTLYEKPKIDIKNLDISFQNNVIYIYGAITEVEQYIAQVFINDSSNVSNLNYDYVSSRLRFCCAPTTNLTQYIYLSETPYNIGDTVYVSIYFINYFEDSGYWDYEKDKYIYLSYKKGSDAIKLILE